VPDCDACNEVWEESFPSSDPPASSAPGHSSRSRAAVTGAAAALSAGQRQRDATIRAGKRSSPSALRLDTPKEADYFGRGGILHYVLKQLLAPAL
jgi:aconitase A